MGGVKSYQNGDSVWKSVKNVFAGLVFGAATAGAILCICAGFAGAILGAKATVLGVTVSRAFALGTLALNSVAIFGPLLGIEVEAVEYDPTTPYIPAPTTPYSHPALK